MRNWSDVVPPDIAVQQVRWERDCSAYRMRQAGLTYAAVGKRLGICAARAKELSDRRARMLKHNGGRSPVEFYLAESAIKEIVSFKPLGRKGLTTRRALIKKIAETEADLRAMRSRLFRMDHPDRA